MRSSASIFDRRIATAALGDAARKLDPRALARNPVMLVVELGSVLVTVLLVTDLPGADTQEVVYAYASAVNNNGSAFGGLDASTDWFETTLGLAMLFGRFVTIALVLALAGSLVRKQRVPATPGTLPTGTGLFAALLVGTIVLVAGLTFVPVLALGPILEHLSL